MRGYKRNVKSDVPKNVRISVTRARFNHYKRVKKKKNVSVARVRREVRGKNEKKKKKPSQLLRRAAGVAVGMCSCV